METKEGIEKQLIFSKGEVKGEIRNGYYLGFFDSYVDTKTLVVTFYYDPFNLNDKTKILSERKNFLN